MTPLAPATFVARILLRGVSSKTVWVGSTVKAPLELLTHLVHTTALTDGEFVVCTPQGIAPFQTLHASLVKVDNGVATFLDPSTPTSAPKSARHSHRWP